MAKSYTLSVLYSSEKAVTSYGINVPGWIEQVITASQVAAILESGCESGAYMPAVTYYDAAQTMAEHGDDVLDYLADSGESYTPPSGTSWSGIAVHYLSAAVELWALQIEYELRDAIEEQDDTEETEASE